ncbi:MAG: ATP-dependent DNA helicase PcrA [Candidatus Reconcilbacillus cellulovorans]|uniref:ATP-dependent DNA helicase n=1 Tax=Candidatus Reconcilbacillus cellulovorans TaxID=1906605 RepID=A0A2A6E292_9BACL|nr:MAG: ATP-dependent DNA helicase PcrA [Candidatus Reconcilbacillus cellulovorans]
MNTLTNWNEILETLNPEQRLAVETTDGPLLVLAGAGSGKTRVLTHRAAHLVATGKAAPWNILAITFTNKAAREMQERVERLVGPSARHMWVMTFHAMCVRILRRHADRIGYARDFTVLDATDQQAVIRACLKDLNLDPEKYPPRALQSAISAAKNELVSPEQFEQRAGHGPFAKAAVQVYHAYRKRLAANQAMDFDDLIAMTVELFRKNPDVLEEYRDKFRYIHVDEYQDTNRAQYVLCRLLADGHRNICVVGDGDQSIYGWRGADMRNILSFEQDYPDAKTILLERNYRSTGNILEAANHVIGHNAGRKPKRLWTDRGPGAKIGLYEAGSELEEGFFVAERILRNRRAGRRFADHAVLYRTNAQSRVIEETLIKSDIPYRIVGGLRFYERAEIKDVLAYLRLVANPHDDISFVRAVNAPKRGVGEATLDRLAAFAAAQGMSMFAALGLPEALDAFGPKIRAALVGFRDLIAELNARLNELPVTGLIEEVLERSGYRRELERENTDEARARLENIGELLSVAQEFEKRSDDRSLVAFLTDVALIADVDALEDGENAPDAVVLMTMHSAKGLEFPVVFIVGMEEGVFPLARAALEPEQLEEERRLAYVGITRAREELYLSYARTRTLYGRPASNTPSRFVSEIPEHLIERLGGRGMFAAPSYAAVASARPKSVAERSSDTGAAPAAGRNGSAGGAAGDATFAPGDKVEHAKWGAGVVVAVKGSGPDAEIQVAFPAPVGVKRLLARFAPIVKRS